MLNLSELKTAFITAVDGLGIPLTFKYNQTGATLDIVAGFRTAGLKDEMIVNSYGVGAKIITVKSSDFTTIPEQYDTIGNTIETYTIQDVQPVHAGVETIGYKFYIKGK